MIGMVAKFIVLTVMVLAVNSFPAFINSSYEGYVPENSQIQLTKGTDDEDDNEVEASVGVVQSSSGKKNDVDEQDNSNEVNGDDPDGGKQEAFNQKSDKDIGEVAGQAIENDNPIVSCEDDGVDCEESGLSETPTNTPSKVPSTTVVPTSTPEPTNFPSITLSPKPTFYPCPTGTIEGNDEISTEFPCPTAY